MYLQKLYLQFFRSYTERTLAFEKNTTVLVGPNAAGKTNILEAIHLLSTGESFRAEKVEEMVHWEEEVGHVAGRVRYRNGEDVDLQVTLTRGMVQEKRVAKRKYRVNGVSRRKKDFVGKLKAVVFLPEDLDLITGSPGLRRRFLNDALSQVDGEYARALGSYEKALRRRNKILDAIAEGKTSRQALTFWDQLLIKEGNILTDKRRDFVEYINEYERQGRFEGLRMNYQPSTVSEARLKQYAHREVGAGYTLIGPHRDDFSLLLQGRELSLYGSRGQQRMGVLWLKTTELEFMSQAQNTRPILLLDDIFSELDEEHEQVVYELLDQQQTIITTTEIGAQQARTQDVEVVDFAS